jgi:hypothetical protein
VNKFVLFLILAYQSLGLGTQSDDLENHPFPLIAGTAWLYKGVVRSTSVGSNEVTTTLVEWRMEVRRVIQHGNVRAAIVNGFPADLDWSDGRPQPQDSLLMESEGRFYLITNDLAESVRRLEQPSDDLAGLFREDTLILQWPLKANTKFCDAEGMARPDNRYCWFVAETRVGPLPAIKGIRPGKHTEFLLQYQTNPDDTSFTFVPGVGITQYGYHHHGTIADTELKLIEFRPAALDRQ